MKRWIAGVAVLALLVGATSVQGAIIAQDLGTGAPPATLGGYSMTAFAPDNRPLNQNVNSVPSPLGGSVGFSIPLNHLRIGQGWATWSHGYTGDVYWTLGARAVTLTMPALTGAFYLYAEPNPFALHTITVTADDGTQLTVQVQGYAGANGYGFYATGGTTIVSLAVASPTADFAVGEFGIAAVPEPASIAVWSLLGGLGLIVGWRRRRRAA